MNNTITVTSPTGPGVSATDVTLKNVTNLEFDLVDQTLNVKAGTTLSIFDIKTMTNFSLSYDPALGYSSEVGGEAGRIAVTVDFAITAAADAPDNTLTIDGDYTAFFIAGAILTVTGSTGNDGDWTVASSEFSVDETIITVVEDLPDDTADGDIVVLTFVP